MPAPVVAATHGVCLGGGFQIALGADLRVAAPGCRFSVMEAKWGLIPDMSATVTLRELVPEHAERPPGVLLSPRLTALASWGWPSTDPDCVTHSERAAQPPSAQWKAAAGHGARPKSPIPLCGAPSPLCGAPSPLCGALSPLCGAPRWPGT